STRQKGLAALSLKGNEPWRRALNQGQGYLSCGWVFNADTVFDTVPLLEWVRLNPVERIKGVMRIPEGTLVVNRQGHDLKIETRQVPPLDSRIELISTTDPDWNSLQHELLGTRLRKGV
ncbi:TPA: GTP-binding protein, partial [Yersinia enterocolitica]|nr:GTP-binding protein [Yersinia enterocolitica]